MLPLWGFILGGWVTFSFLPLVVHVPQARSTLFQAIAFFGGGILGAAIATPLYYVIIFLSGAALGGIAGVMIGAVVDIGGINSFRNVMTFTQMFFPPVPQSNTQIILMVIFGLILGAIALGFQKFMLIASSSFLGSALIVSGLISPITNIGATDVNRAALMLLVFLVLSVLGMIVQFRMSGDV